MRPALKLGWVAGKSLVWQVWRAWRSDYAASMGAALAYYTLFSLAPLLLIVISVAGLVFGEAAARGEIQAQLDTLMGPHSARAVQDLLVSVHQPAKGVAATLLGLGLLLAGAASVFGELQDALDRIWRVPVPSGAPGNGTDWLALLRSRLLAYGMILALGFLLTVSLVINALLDALGHTLAPVFQAWQTVVALGSATAGFLLAALLFALIFKVMPRVHVLWKDVWVGALFTAVLFALGKSLIGAYIGRSGAASGFGAAGSLVVILLWVYWSAQILLIGAEFTWVYANLFGSRKPDARTQPLQSTLPSTLPSIPASTPPSTPAPASMPNAG
jgi:membrane protein